MAEKKAGDEEKQSGSASLIVAYAKALLMLWAFAFLVYNSPKLSSALSNLKSISIPGTFTLEVSPAVAMTGSPIADWLTQNRIEPRVEIISASLDQPEFLQIRATEKVNLSRGYIGDSNELLQLPAASVLQAKECVRIYTSIGTEDPKKLDPGKGCVDPVVVMNSDGTPRTEGIFKSAGTGKDDSAAKDEKKGKNKKGLAGDRIVLFDSSKHAVLDFDYWWIRKAEAPR